MPIIILSRGNICLVFLVILFYFYSIVMRQHIIFTLLFLFAIASSLLLLFRFLYFFFFLFFHSNHFFLCSVILSFPYSFLIFPLFAFSPCFSFSMRSRISKRGCVRPSVRPSLRPSLRHTRVEFLRNRLNLNKIAPETFSCAI